MQLYCTQLPRTFLLKSVKKNSNLTTTVITQIAITMLGFNTLSLQNVLFSQLNMMKLHILLLDRQKTIAKLIHQIPIELKCLTVNDSSGAKYANVYDTVLRLARPNKDNYIHTMIGNSLFPRSTLLQYRRPKLDSSQLFMPSSSMKSFKIDVNE